MTGTVRASQPEALIMDPKKIYPRRDMHRIEAEVAELSEVELSVVSGGKASAGLMQKCATGKHFPTATITV
jgi:type VI protein secretion system component Hcp